MPEVSYHQLSQARCAAAVACAVENPARGLGRRLHPSGFTANWKSLRIWRRLQKNARKLAQDSRLSAFCVPCVLLQATPDAGSFLQFWLVLAFLSNVAMAIAVIASAFSNRKQRREISQSFEPAAKQDFEQHVRDSETNFLQIRNEMREDRQHNQNNASFRTAALYKKIDEIRVELSNKIDSLK